MDSGLYSAYTALLARTQSLDVAANNLANAGTNGFRAAKDTFRGWMSELISEPASQVGSAANQFGVLGGSRLSTAQGLLTSTGNPLDVAIEGAGFFTVKTQHGLRYTRDGSFRVSDSGTLTDSANNPVLDAGGSPISLPSGEVKIGADGSVSVSGIAGSAIAGRLGIADFAAGDLVAAEGAGSYKAVGGATALSSAATVRQGVLEGSNEDAVHGTMQLMLMQRQAEMMQRALTVFHNDFDKIAAEELPRV